MGEGGLHTEGVDFMSFRHNGHLCSCRLDSAGHDCVGAAGLVRATGAVMGGWYYSVFSNNIQLCVVCRREIRHPEALVTQARDCPTAMVQ